MFNPQQQQAQPFLIPQHVVFQAAQPINQASIVDSDPETTKEDTIRQLEERKLKTERKWFCRHIVFTIFSILVVVGGYSATRSMWRTMMWQFSSWQYDYCQALVGSGWTMVAALIMFTFAHLLFVFGVLTKTITFLELAKAAITAFLAITGHAVATLVWTDLAYIYNCGTLFPTWWSREDRFKVFFGTFASFAVYWIIFLVICQRLTFVRRRINKLAKAIKNTKKSLELTLIA